MDKENKTFLTENSFYNKKNLLNKKKELIAAANRLISLGINDKEIEEDIKLLNERITEIEIAFYGKKRTLKELANELLEQLIELDELN